MHIVSFSFCFQFFIFKRLCRIFFLIKIIEKPRHQFSITTFSQHDAGALSSFVVCILIYLCIYNTYIEYMCEYMYVCSRDKEVLVRCGLINAPTRLVRRAASPSQTTHANVNVAKNARRKSFRNQPKNNVFYAMFTYIRTIYTYHQ